jgi:prefoldin subunit 5
MTASTNPTDDIIELTEIVEEGIPLDKTFEDFSMDKAVDSTSLDQELDDLLRDAEPQPKAPPKVEDEIDLDILFDEPAPAAPQFESSSGKTKAPAPGMDMADLDDLFDSLGIGDNEDGDTALDIILDEDIPQPDKPGIKTFYPSDSIDLELELPGLENGDKTGNVHDLTDELLADIPEAPLLQSPTDPTAQTHPAAEPLHPNPAQEQPDENAVILELTEEHVEEPAPAGKEASAVVTDREMPDADLIEDPVQQVAPKSPQIAPDGLEAVAPATQTHHPAEPAPAIHLAELEIISSRLDILESRPQGGPALNAEEILALMPHSPQELPVTQNLRREILEHVETRLADLAAKASVEGLQESVNALQSQVESLPDIRTELAMTSPLAAVQKLEADLEELRTLIQPAKTFSPSRYWPCCHNPRMGWPVALALRQDIVEHVETRIANLLQTASVNGLQESVNALQSQVESIPDIRAELAKTPSRLSRAETGDGP